MSRKTGPDKATVDMVFRRSEGRCERCGVREGQQVHHRRPRGSGGTRDPHINATSNLVHVCFPCHSAIEANRTASLGGGWLLSRLSEVDAWSVPVSMWHGDCLLDNEGGSVAI